MWGDIMAANAGPIARCIDEYIGQLVVLKERLAAGELEKPWEEAAAARRAIPAAAKGFLSPLSEVLAVVPDRPGVIAVIAAALAAESINIKDIEVLKVRENEGGSLRFAFETKAAAGRAAAIMDKLGFAARERE
jgi:prephenate dehydrogenase